MSVVINYLHRHRLFFVSAGPMGGIYMNDHEALNFMWGYALSEINCAGITGVDVSLALQGARLYNHYDFLTGDSKSFWNQDNHDKAIAYGYLSSSVGAANFSTERDKQVKFIVTPQNKKPVWQQH